MHLNCPHAWEEYKKLDLAYDALRREYLALRGEQSSDNSNEFKNVPKEWLLRMREFRGRCLPFRNKICLNKEFSEINLKNLQKKIDNNIELSKRDLRFLYGLDGWPTFQTKVILDGIIESRGKRKDLSKALGCREDQISFSQDEFGDGKPTDFGVNFSQDEFDNGKNIIFNWGTLELDNYNNAHDLKLPKYVRGSLFLDSLKSAEGLVLPKEIFGVLDLSGLKSTDYLDFSDCMVYNSIYLFGLSTEQKKQLRTKYPHIADQIQ